MLVISKTLFPPLPTHKIYQFCGARGGNDNKNALRATYSLDCFVTLAMTRVLTGVSPAGLRPCRILHFAWIHCEQSASDAWQSSRNNKVRKWRNFIYLDSGGHHPQNLTILLGPNKPRNESKRSAGCGKDVSPQATLF